MKQKLVVLFLAVFLTTGPLHAADAPPSQPPAASQPAVDVAQVLAKATEYGQRRAKQFIEAYDPVVSLSEEQKKEITESLVDFRKSLAEYQIKNAAKFKAIGDAMDKATAAGDQEGLAIAQQDQQSLSEPITKIYDKHRTRFDKILTFKQKAKWDDWMLTKTIKEMAAPIELTEQQLKAVKAAAIGQEQNPWQAIDEALNNMLTPQQRTQMKKHKVMEHLNWNFQATKFSPEQIKQVEALCDNLLKDPELPLDDLLSKLVEKMETLLTPEQKEARKKFNAGN